MEIETAVTTLSALAQPMRLAAFRWLIAAEPEGLLAGELAQVLERPPSTLSANLAILHAAGLVASAREGRGIRYRAQPQAVAALAAFLTEECCGGRADLCR